MTTTELTGAELRDQGVADAIAADTAVHRGLRTDIEAILDTLAQSGQVFTADDIRRFLPADVRDRIPPNLLPAVVRTASMRGEIEHIGWGISIRSSRHAGPVRRWIGAGHPKLRQWWTWA